MHVMKLIIKAENGGVTHNYAIEKDTFLALIEQAFTAEVEGQSAWKKEPVKAGGCVSGFLHAYGVTQKKIDDSGIEVFPKVGEFTPEHVKLWMDAFLHKNDTAQRNTIEAKQAAWDKKVAEHAAEMEAEGIKPERALELAKKHAGKRPEAKEGKAPSGKAEVLAALA